MIELRDYQEAAVSAVYDYLRAKSGNPCAVLPTGSGKTPVIARLCADAVTLWNGRVLVLAHVKELLEQTADKLKVMCPTLAVGVYSAGLKRRDTAQAVIVAGIQSVHDKADQLGRFDLVVVDEAHLIPPDGDGRYRSLIAALLEINPDLRVIGLTATPYRLAGGLICGPDRLLTDVCYEVGVKVLVQRGFLSRLVGKAAHNEVDTQEVKVERGEFVEAEAEAAFTGDGVVRRAAAEVVAQTLTRRAVMLFCQSVGHARQVAGYLRAELKGREVLAAAETLPAKSEFGLGDDPLAHHAIPVVYDWLLENGHPAAFLCEWLRRDHPRVAEVYGDTKAGERDQVVADFKAGRIRYLVNVGVFTTGFDAPNVDAVCLLRMTASPGLYYQMVGRGFRLSEGKADCLILDFGENIKRHGPVDVIERRIKAKANRKPGERVTAEPAGRMCPACRAVVAAAMSVCTECGAEFEVVTPPAHRGTADGYEPLSGKVSTETVAVDRVEYRVHRKKGAAESHPKTLRVTYTLGINDHVSEWVCVEHSGFAGDKARGWWRRRCRLPMPASAVEAAMYAQHGLLAEPVTVTLRKKSGETYPELAGHDLGEIPDGPAPCPGCGAVNLRGILPNGDPRYPGRVVCQECDHPFGWADHDTVGRYGFVTDPGRDFGGLLPTEFVRSGAANECPQCGVARHLVQEIDGARWWCNTCGPIGAEDEDLDESPCDGPRDSEDMPAILPGFVVDDCPF